jgi:hypothetical protein
MISLFDATSPSGRFASYVEQETYKQVCVQPGSLRRHALQHGPGRRPMTPGQRRALHRGEVALAALFPR